uniref:Uncharacterized protein n=1 Tax=Rousettus aegyptiacus TaxID=9407 RepID=A0A7J8KBM2_ROUAE|nr:hypothetical protein HJG63_008062 [Rousettus aegyptiacus]
MRKPRLAQAAHARQGGLDRTRPAGGAQAPQPRWTRWRSPPPAELPLRGTRGTPSREATLRCSCCISVVVLGSHTSYLTGPSGGPGPLLADHPACPTGPCSGPAPDAAPTWPPGVTGFSDSWRGPL